MDNEFLTVADYIHTPITELVKKDGYSVKTGARIAHLLNLPADEVGESIRVLLP